MRPFTTLHICSGNICRSPMAERLFALALRRRVGNNAEVLYRSHSAGTGGWHAGEPMNAPAGRQLAERGADPSGFRARRIAREMVDQADLILCAAAEHVDAVLELSPEARPRTFVLGEFGRLLGGLDLAVLPPAGLTPAAAYDRGVALVVAADAERGGGAVWGSDGEQRAPARRGDDLADPWGLADEAFARVADKIDETVEPLAAALTDIKV